MADPIGGYERLKGAIASAHVHTNKTVLDLIDKAGTNLAYNGDVLMTTKSISESNAKTTPDSTDLLPIVEVGTPNVLKRITWTGMLSALKTYFDTLYSSVSSALTTESVKAALGITTLSGANTGDETTQTIKTKLGVSTLSGGNTGDETAQTIVDKIGNGTVINSSYLPSYVDDVLEFANLAGFPGTGESGKIYVTLDNNFTYRWTGSVYVEISKTDSGTIGIILNGATAKTTPIDADLVAIGDTSVLKKTTWANIKATLKTYFDTLYTLANLGGVSTSTRDATGGYVGLTLFKINFKNAANTFTSFFTNSNTAARTYTFPDKDGTIATTADITNPTTSTIGVLLNGSTDKATPVDADLVAIGDTSVLKKTTWANIKATLKTYFDTLYTLANLGGQATSGKDATGGYVGLTLYKINFKNAANTITNFFTNATTVARTWTFPDKDGTVAMTSDIVSAPAETATTIGVLINGSTDKATPIDADLVAIGDTSVLKKTTWANIKATLKTYFDTLYSGGAATEVIVPTGVTLTAAQVNGTVINNLGQGAANVAVVLPLAAAGMNFILQMGTTQASYTYKLTANAANKLFLNGVAGTTGQSVSNNPTQGNYITFVTMKTAAAPTWDWIATTGQGTWTAVA